MLPENQMQECIVKGRLVRVLANRCSPFPSHHLYYPIQAADWRCKPSLCSSKRCATAVQIGNDRMKADIRVVMSAKCHEATI